MQSRTFARIFLPAVLMLGLLVLLILVMTETWPPARPDQPEVPAALASNRMLDTASINKAKTHILIEKSRYRLQLLQTDSLLKMYPVVFGPEPVGDKYQEGDGRTPEGHFKIRSMYDHASWSKFIWVDYPNAESWNRFNKRKIEGTLSEGATIGSEIGIHGVPNGRDDAVRNRQNWTLGCISLRTKDIIELYAVVQVGTAIEIVP